MNILYVLQQSVYNNDNKWTSADSNINMMIGIFNELLTYTDHEFYVLISPLNTFADIKSYDELLKNKRIHWIEYNFPINAFLNRQHFNVYEFDNMFQQLPKINIVWNNIDELSRNIKTYLFYKSPDTKLISCCYWLDCPEINQEKVDTSISYQFRQFDGFECSDLAVFTCESTKNAFFNNAKKFLKQNKIKKINEKYSIWDFGFAQSELNKYKTNSKFNKKTILFLNRLSGINYTHHEEFIDAVNSLYEIRQDFQVILTNPSGKFSWPELKRRIKPLHILSDKTLSRQQYTELLWKSDISVHLYEKELYGGVAMRESLFANNIIIAPKLYEYKRILGNNYNFYTNKNFKNLESQISLALDTNNFVYSNKVIQRNNDSSFEVVKNIVINDLNELNYV